MRFRFSLSRARQVALSAGITLLLSSCATFYQKTAILQEKIAAGDFQAAYKELEKDKKWAEDNHRVLYFMNRGLVHFMLGEHEASNEYFNKADYYIEDYSKSFGTEALALVTNPMARPYKPEDFESIMIHFYKAFNFIAMNDYESALVECRRIDIRLMQFNEKYKENKSRYTRDAFAHNLMGMIYQAAGDYNNAFIAYRNALEIYESDYNELFGVTPPLQLKLDLLYCAKKVGFNSEVRFYEEKYALKTPEMKDGQGDLVYIWMNGLGPVKAEWSLNLTNMGYKDGLLLFGSEELNFSYPITLSSVSSSIQSQLKDLSVIRVAFPKYVERPPVYVGAQLNYNGESHKLEMAENINKIAFQSLRDRMLREIGNNLLRIATKQAMEYVARKENDNLGAIVSIVNAMTEKADTRNWQSLPYSLYYTRVSMPEGEQVLTLEQQDSFGKLTSEEVKVNIKAGKSAFQIYHQLASYPMLQP